MEYEIIYWHWIILGAALLLLEIVLPSFTALWFGAAAIIISALLWLFPAIPLPAQIILWTIFSILLTWLWFKYLKPLSVDKTFAGLSREAIIGQIGQVIALPYEHQRGTLRFSAPILGADEWQFITEDTLALGDRVRVVEISGNSLIVTKH
jgi:hypothetical protein